MGVSISFRGAQPSPPLRAAALSFAREHASAMEWRVEAVSLERPQAFLGTRVFECARIEGVSLLPHFACEPLPLVFLDGPGLLVDSFVRDEGRNEVSLTDGPLLKTQFAGPAVHEEVCDFLAELKRRFVPDLEVDDESGFYAGRDREALEAAYAAAWKEIAAQVRDSLREGSAVFEVGGFHFDRAGVDSSGGEWSLLEAEHRALVEQAEAWLASRFGGLGYKLDRTRASVEDLDLVMSDADDEGWAEQLDDPDVEAFVHASGAAFGRTLAALLGGAWRFDEEDGLVLADVGGLGLRVNPFQVAADRLVGGPAHGFGHHLGLFDAFVRHLR